MSNSAISCFRGGIEGKGKFADTLPGQVKDGVGKRRRQRGQTRFAYASCGFVIFHDEDFDRRDVIDTGHMIGMKIIFHCPPLLEMSLVFDGCTQAHYDRTLHLRTNNIRVYVPAAIYQRCDLIDLYLAIRLMGYLNHLTNDAAKAFGDSYSPDLAISPGLPPAKVS